MASSRFKKASYVFLPLFTIAGAMIYYFLVVQSADKAVQQQANVRFALQQGLTPEDEATLQLNLETLSNGWQQESVNSANAIFRKAEYGPVNWEMFFEKYFNTQGHAFTDKLFDYLQYPAFFWFPDIHGKLQEALINPLLNKVNVIMEAHATGLQTALAADPVLTQNLLNSLRVFGAIAGENGAIQNEQRNTLYSGIRNLILSSPQYLKADSTFSGAGMGGLSQFRAQTWMAFSGIQDLTSAVKSDIAQSLGLHGRYLDIWNDFSILIHDNNGFDSIQLNAIYNYLKSIPKEIYNLRHITQIDSMGFSGSDAAKLRGGARVNIFNIKVGSISGNEFPSDIEPRKADTFSIVLAHELNHNVDAYYIKSNADKSARQSQLISQAGCTLQQYLRNMKFMASSPCFFVESPQEFFASISNQWFADSKHAIDLGIHRFDLGFREPFNQALFFAEIYSGGGDATWFYQINSSGDLTYQRIPVGRSPIGYIDSLLIGGVKYSFSRDAEGNVTGYTILPATSTPAPTPTPIVSPVPTPVATSAPTPVPTPTHLPTPTFVPTPTPSPIPIPTPIPAPTPHPRAHPKPSDYNLREGDTIRATDPSDPDIYIVNNWGYKRLFLNPVIFRFYGHLGGFQKVKNVTSAARDAFITSGLFRNCKTNDPKVYALEVTGEDTGILHWVNMSAAQAAAEESDFFKKVFCINNNEFNWYTKSPIHFTSLSHIPVYSR